MTTASESDRSVPKRRSAKWLEPMAMLLPGGVWLLLFLVVPTLLIFVKSFVALGGGLSTENYLRVFEGSGGIFVFLIVIGRSILFSVTTTLLCLLIGFPVAYWLALMSPKRWQNLLLLAFVLPLWTSSLLRTYAWITILRPSGVLNGFLGLLGLPSLFWLNKTEGVLIGMVYTYLPYMVLVLYSSLEKLDTHLLEAAADLGANSRQTFFQVTVPQVAPGIVAASALVAITSFGDFINPRLLGGPSDSMISSVIELQFLGASRNWGFGSALSMVLILGVSIAIALLIKYGDRSAVTDV